MPKRRPRSRLLPFLLLATAALLAGMFFLRRGGEASEELTFDEFRQALDAGEIESAVVRERSSTITGELTDGTEFRATFHSEYGDELTDELAGAGVDLDFENPPDSIWLALLYNFLPVLLIFGLVIFLLTSMGGSGGRGVLQFGKSRAKRLTGDEPKVTFADVAGCDEAVEELIEIRDFLADPERFRAIGARIPKGVLLFGPPGTGKTLLARAVAGEAGVPFFSISGSDFVEMFVGVGASRVRDLFEQAKTSAPAIIFVDEIDAVGRHRGSGLGGGHDEREQTLNQLLVEMDGFDARTGVILIAATNRPDILDPALLRPGRFDRQIVVDQPDLVGRRAILEVHAKGKPLANGVSLDVLARRTPGFTGADLANLLNEAALLAARRGKTIVDMAECEAAIDRVIAGPERKTRVLSEHEKSVIAYHEAGHALVGHVLPNTDPIHKVSVIARGRALGWTLSLPVEDKVLHTRSQLVDRLAMLFGGRTAEELVFGDVTTGAQDDIEKATQIARSMITEWGMSDSLGLRQFNLGGHDGFGRETGVTDYGDEVAKVIDDEIRRLLDAAHDEARSILVGHRATLDRLAARLVEKETLDEAELADVFGDVADQPRPRPEPTPAPPADDVEPLPVRVPVGASAAVAPSGWSRWRDRIAGRRAPA